ncbi:fimbrial biogenesis chaperone, partial [Escherichia coli]|uniref:fimbrial biogenesis chaperone n=1 Tax=Escherichia coli TaxID=562 RepID=UPI001CC08F78
MQTTRTPYSISFMATVLLLLLFACHSTVANAAVALGATRVIYPANQKQVLLPVTNNDPASVYLIQSWIENAGDQKDTQFVITPPLFSMQGKKENTLRIINATNHQLPGDRESLFWVNVKAIPAMEKDQKNENTLQLAIISRLNLQSKCNKKRSTHQLEYNFVSTQKPFPNDEYFLPTSYNKRA